jgi:hypothetical protein
METTEQFTPMRPQHSLIPASDFHRLGAAQIADLGVAVHDSGLAAYPQLIQELARAGSLVAPAAAAVLASENEPIVARERALAVVSTALVGAQATSR